MKGLVFKEFYLGRKNLILATFSWIIIVMIGILLRLSLLYGNMAKMPKEDYASNEIVIYYVFMYLPIALIMSLNIITVQNIYSDHSTKWMQFGYTMPVSEYRYVGSKFLVTGILSGGGFILSLVNASVMCRMWDRSFDTELFLSLLSLTLFMMIFSAVNCALAYRFRNPNSAGILLAVIMLGSFFGFGKFLLKVDRMYPELSGSERSKYIDEYIRSLFERTKEKYFDVIPLLLLISVAAILLLYFLCVRGMKRRER